MKRSYGFSNSAINVQLPDNNNVVKFPVGENSTTVLYLAPGRDIDIKPSILKHTNQVKNKHNKQESLSPVKDVFASAGGDFIPVVHNLNDNDTVTVNVSHIASIILPLQPEWWLQIADVTGSDQEMEKEICNTISTNWDLVNNGTTVGDCNLTILETFEQANGTSKSD